MPNSKQNPIPKIPNSKPEDLEDRTFKFAKNCKSLVKSLPKNTTNAEYAKQLVRSSGSVAANYIEANEALSKKDSVMRFRICRKEAKESRMWLKLVDVNTGDDRVQESLCQEATELIRIFTSIIGKMS